MNRPWWLIPLILGFVGGWLFVGPPKPAHSFDTITEHWSDT